MKKYILITAMVCISAWLIYKNVNTDNQSEAACFYNFKPKTFIVSDVKNITLEEMKKNIAEGGTIADLSAAVEKAMAKEDFAGLVQFKNTINELIRVPAANKSNLHMLRAKLNLSQHQFAETLDDLQIASLQHPLESKYVQAYTLLALGKLDEAKTVTQNILNEFPSQKTYVLMALIEKESDNTQKAYEYFSKAICLDDLNEPDVSYKVRRQFADFLHDSGQKNEAENAYQFLATLDAKNPDFTYGLAQVAAAKKETTKAIELIDQSLKVSQDAKYLIFKAELLQKTGSSETALEILKQAENTVRAEIASGGFGHSAELAEILLLQGLPDSLVEAKKLIAGELKKRTNKKLRLFQQKLNSL